MIDPTKAEILVKEIVRPSRDEVEKVREHGMVPTGPSDVIGQKIVDAIYEISSHDIPIANAIKIFISYLHGADSEHSISAITNIDAWTCKTVLDILHKHGLLNNNFYNT